MSEYARPAETPCCWRALTASCRCESSSRFFRQLLHRVNLEGQLGNDAVFAPALVFELLQANQVAGLKTSVTIPQQADRVRVNTVLASEFGRRRASIELLEDPDDLALAKRLLRTLWSPWWALRPETHSLFLSEPGPSDHAFKLPNFHSFQERKLGPQVTPRTWTVSTSGVYTADSSFLLGPGGYQSYPQPPPVILVSGPSADTSEADTITIPYVYALAD
jgi:hypothetical protein